MFSKALGHPDLPEGIVRNENRVELVCECKTKGTHEGFPKPTTLLKGKSGFTTSWAQMKDYTMPTSHTKFLVFRLNITPEIKRRTCLNLHVAQPP